MEKAKKTEIITRSLSNFLTGLKISRDMDIDAAERVNPYNLEAGECAYEASITAAIYDEAINAVLRRVADLLGSIGEEVAE